MEATKQAERIVKTWTDTQMKMWDSWVEALRGTAGFKASEGWEQVEKVTVQSWEESVKKALEAQTEWAKMWTDGLLGGKAAPEEIAEGARMVQEMVKSWVEAQERFWDGWFMIARRLGPSTIGRGWEKVLEAWQQALRKASDAQKEWVASARETARATKAREASA